MKDFLKIILIFAALYATFSNSEIYLTSECDIVTHKCCGDETQNNETQNQCTPLCYCFNLITLESITPANFNLDVIFTHNLADTKSSIEGQTESIFRPPEA